ncbi:MAG TPA: Coagulation factor 5/8 type domain-containing protein [Solirubrobacteraceae bacterium]|nr:Coagulation factor 5/8 type domain-containing protein [Solirubrobacteraceae bacterium]
MARRTIAAAVAVLAGIGGTAGLARASAPRLANRCVALDGSSAAHGRFFFKPTGLGTFRLYAPDRTLLAVGSKGAVTHTATPGPAAEWAVRARGAELRLRSTAIGRVLTARASAARGCVPYPEAGLDARGTPFRGTLPDGSVFGYADAHLHITANLRAGGRVISGEPFDRFGITEALGHDADEHGPDGSLDVTGNLLRSGNPVGTHDTHGWPTFTGWPVHDTYTHQQVYYRWLQRAWLAGMRLVVAQLVEDQPLCEIEPLRSHSCDETATIELEARELRALRDYVDAQSGGRGRGWLQIVYDPAQARRVIEQGKLAVVMGVESSDPFDCPEKLGLPQCDRAAVDAGIALYRRLGIRAMFVTHWVDNAFGGAALEGGSEGTFIGAMQVEQTGMPFATGPCPEPGEGVATTPLLGPQCNTQGLTDLGHYLIERLMDAHMLIEADHLSEQTRLDVLALAEARHYPLISSHNGTGGAWTPSQLRRLHALGGFVTATPEDAAPLAQKIDSLQAYGFAGVGLGTDTGGFNALPGPDPNASKDPLPYPFRSYDGRVLFSRQQTGTRTFDVNTDGVAHYGLFPDLLANVQRAPGGGQAMSLLFHSAEAYLDTWQLALQR